MALMEWAWRARRPIFTNIKLHPACPFYSWAVYIGSPEWPVAVEQDLYKPGCGNPQYYWQYITVLRERYGPRFKPLIVVDEVDLFFDSNAHKDFKRAVMWWHKQHAKHGCDIVYIAQVLTNVYKRIRDQGQRYTICEHNYKTARAFSMVERFLGRRRTLALSRFFYFDFTDSKFRNPDGQGYYGYRDAQRFFNWYDTKELIGDYQREVEGSWWQERNAVQDGTADSGVVVRPEGRGGNFGADGERGWGGSALAS